MAKKFDFKEAYKQQKSEGVDIQNPMNNLITGTGEEQGRTAEPSAEIHAVERRTKRVQLVMTQTLYERVKEEADRIGISFNEYVNQLCTKATQ